MLEDLQELYRVISLPAMGSTLLGGGCGWLVVPAYCRPVLLWCGSLCS